MYKPAIRMVCILSYEDNESTKRLVLINLEIQVPILNPYRMRRIFPTADEGTIAVPYQLKGYEFKSYI